jgi:sigma-B regulation protein RsbU (phosphoserine phosphatase)
MQILIAEDDAISRRILEKTLTNWGYSVVVTEDGNSAWEALKTGNFKLAVLDWMMPGMDGVEICNRVRDLKSDNYTYLILLTAKSQKTDIVKGLQSGADDYVTKPFDHEELKSRIQVGKRILFLEEQLAKQVAEISHSNDVMRRDIEIAAQIQRSMLPNELPSRNNIITDYRFLPCEGVGGDMLNAFELDDDHIALYISDVSGHGVPAAMFAIAISRILSVIPNYSSICRTKRDETDEFHAVPPEVVISRLNKQLVDMNSAPVYATMIYGVLNVKTSEFSYVRAGHPEIIIIRDGVGFTGSSAGDLPIGIDSSVEFSKAIIQLQKGDRIYFITDGITEADKYGSTKKQVQLLLQVLSDAYNQSLTDSLDKVIEMVKSTSTGSAPHDDVTILGFEMR